MRRVRVKRTDEMVNKRNRCAVVAFLALLCATLCGCLSVVRFPFPTREDYSDEGVCTNRVWSVPMDRIMRGRGFVWRAYPTVRMRCMVTAHVFSPIDRTKRGEDLYRERHKRWLAIPLALVWATAPLDAAVDTIFMPFDICRTAKPNEKESKR